ncbi:Hemolymph lipopolysaccharide-binding protein [Gryllus bimaculatus]|nr:Hemolymph lipopolysaccharide-binding protein [Gryllus bimaculatus]
MASTLLLLLLLVHGYQAQQVCVSGKKVTLSLDYTTNATGHPKINAPRNYVTLPGLGHFRAPSVALDWLAARDLCRTERAQLAVPASQREVEVVLAHFALNASGATHLEYVWHGTNDFAQEGKWVTDDDVLLENTGFSKFHPGQPSGGNAENCLVLVKSSKLLADAPCSWRLPYICKAAL